MKKVITSGCIAICGTALPILRIGILMAFVATISTLIGDMYMYAFASCIFGGALFLFYVFTEGVFYGADIERWAQNLYVSVDPLSEWIYKLIGNVAGPVLFLFGIPYFLEIEAYIFTVLLLIAAWIMVQSCGQWVHEKIFS